MSPYRGLRVLRDWSLFPIIALAPLHPLPPPLLKQLQPHWLLNWSSSTPHMHPPQGLCTHCLSAWNTLHSGICLACSLTPSGLNSNVTSSKRPQLSPSNTFYIVITPPALSEEPAPLQNHLLWLVFLSKASTPRECLCQLGPGESLRK